jgi:hypothetical protein
MIGGKKVRRPTEDRWISNSELARLIPVADYPLTQTQIIKYNRHLPFQCTEFSDDAGYSWRAAVALLPNQQYLAVAMGETQSLVDGEVFEFLPDTIERANGLVEFLFNKLIEEKEKDD